MEPSEARFRATFDDAPTGIALVDLQRRLVTVNRALGEMFGYAATELVGRTLDHITHPDDLGPDAAATEDMLAGHSDTFQRVKRYRHRDGRIVHAQLWASLVRDRHGAPSHFIAHVQDITALHLATGAADEARRLLEESQRAAQVGSWSFQLDSGELTWSDSQYRLHGLAPQPGPHTVEWFLELLPAEDRGGIADRIARRRAAGEGFCAEYRVSHPDGSEHVLSTRAERLPADPHTGRPARVCGVTRDVTAERAAVRDRREVERRHMRLLAGLPDTMVSLCDRELRCVLAQGALVAELGIAQDEIEGRRLEEFLPAELAARIGPALTAALGGETTAFELADAGRTFHVEVVPYLGDREEISGAFSVWRDVTVQIERERENRLLASMVQQTEDAIIAKDVHGHIVEWSPGAVRLYGYPRAEMLGRSISVIVGPERDGEDRELLGEALAGRYVQRDTVRRRKDGSRVNVSLSVSPLCDDSGAPCGALVIARDISSRIRELAARREAEDRLRVTIDHAPIGVALVDLHEPARGRLISANAPFGALIGDPDPVAARLSLHSVVHPEDAAALRSDLTLLSCDVQARTETEVRCLRPDGTTVWLLLTGAAVPSGEDPRVAPGLAVVHALDIGERKRFEGQLQHLADHDPLTGLFNRRRFESELARAAAHVRRYRRPGALLLLDLDGFKHVNDTMGHSHGDALITRIGATLREVVRETDVIGRLGGDEFAVVLTAVSDMEAVKVGEKILRAIEQDGVVVVGPPAVAVSASLGVAPMRADGCLDAEELLAEADAAMYVAKQAGRNRAALARGDGARGADLGARQSWKVRLRAAIEDERLELFAQPIRGICAEGIDRYELLLRMRGADGELILPSTFLPGAERHDLVQRIDRWVFGQALGLLSAHEATGRRIGLSVNMSGKTLCDARIADDLAAMVRACPIPRDRLVVEVTETAAIVNIERARHVATTLRELGCRFALDDFGAGFASFYYLKHLDFDYVKIDGEFVRALSTDLTDQLVVRSVVELARGLGAETIAEFVGDAEAIERLRELGVDYGQGFHLGRPAPVQEILPTAIGR